MTDLSDFAYIRRYYTVPAEQGRRVYFHYLRNQGTVIGSEGHYLWVLFDGEDERRLLHPTWELTYMGMEASRAA